MNIISGKPSPMPRLPLISGIIVMLVFSVLVGLNVQPYFLGAHLNSTDFGHCQIARGWPAYVVFESHRFDAIYANDTQTIDLPNDTKKIIWRQDVNGVPLKETQLALQHRFSDANPLKGYFGYSGFGIATNSLVGIAILVTTILLCGRFLNKLPPRVGKSQDAAR